MATIITTEEDLRAFIKKYGAMLLRAGAKLVGPTEREPVEAHKGPSLLLDFVDYVAARNFPIAAKQVAGLEEALDGIHITTSINGQIAPPILGCF